MHEKANFKSDKLHEKSNFKMSNLHEKANIGDFAPYFLESYTKYVFLRKISRTSKRIESRRFVPSLDAVAAVWLRRACSIRHILPSGSDDICFSPFKNTIAKIVPWKGAERPVNHHRLNDVIIS